MTKLSIEKLHKHFLKQGIHPYVIEHLQAAGFFQKLIDGVSTTAKFLYKHRKHIEEGVKQGINIYRKGKSIYDDFKKLSNPKPFITDEDDEADENPSGGYMPSAGFINPNSNKEDRLNQMEKYVRNNIKYATGGMMEDVAPAPVTEFKRKSDLAMGIKYVDAGKLMDDNIIKMIKDLPRDLEELYIDNASHFLLAFVSKSFKVDNLPSTLKVIWLRSTHFEIFGHKIEDLLHNAFSRLPFNIEFVLDSGSYNSSKKWVHNAPLRTIREDELLGKGLKHKSGGKVSGGYISAGKVSGGKLSKKMRERADFMGEMMKGGKHTMKEASDMYEEEYGSPKSHTKMHSIKRRVKIRI